nr:MAG TPA: hypothetical protein [Microviridae sp.]
MKKQKNSGTEASYLLDVTGVGDAKNNLKPKNNLL